MARPDQKMYWFIEYYMNELVHFLEPQTVVQERDANGNIIDTAYDRYVPIAVYSGGLNEQAFDNPAGPNTNTHNNNNHLPYEAMDPWQLEHPANQTSYNEFYVKYQGNLIWDITGGLLGIMRGEKNANAWERINNFFYAEARRKWIPDWPIQE